MSIQNYSVRIIQDNFGRDFGRMGESLSDHAVYSYCARTKCTTYNLNLGSDNDADGVLTAWAKSLPVIGL